MPLTCPVCEKDFFSGLALLKHSENSSCFGGANAPQLVHHGVSTWESSRQQQNAFTGSNANFLGDIEITDDAHNYDTDMWERAMCNRDFNSKHSLSQHINSGVHDGRQNYVCRQCGKGFPRMSSLADHAQKKHGQSMTSRLTHVLSQDMSHMGTRMLTDGQESKRHEALLRFDGGCRPNPGWGGCGFVLQDTISGWFLAKESIPIESGVVTSNVAEYAGLIHGLRSAHKNGIRRLKVEGDSNLVIQQMKGNFAVNSYNLRPHHNKAKALESKFQWVTFHHINRCENSEADDLASDAVNSHY